MIAASFDFKPIASRPLLTLDKKAIVIQQNTNAISIKLIPRKSAVLFEIKIWKTDPLPQCSFHVPLSQ